ncbi:TPA: Na+/H+ antiporter NhaA [Legionella pneumophila]|uniref:Na(+)/H(+) antiporter NhaA n=2 Tax=Legionella pneumophila TaxID=446 RepID=A0AAN2RQD6_LEGPN|nr:Na+/H+ antiporter NhaA [Legionella pneumophila]MCH9091298.1 Na+/H+ antiporter NhaA [Legionella pneumophila serogroup 1]MDW9167184.1 Na+/H+ antiporter NhaA [Legionella pneumophila subsp. fraseri]AMQ28693.1 sodium:proton antiporter [Legionella pneumophila subsp. pneumophila]ANN93397.1 Na+/H+ antiporter NhaA [Legionella pneumophila]MCH9157706.1 Na+/H+ antiporter NhaA [Legionella pneumophila serogroup 1]
MPLNPQLPKELIHWVSKPLDRFIRIETSTAILLLLSTFVALIMANSPWSKSFLSIWDITLGIHLGSFEFSRSIHGWINDGLMTLFFFFVSLELKREFVFGELRKPQMAALPIIAAVGGMLVPALFYLFLQYNEAGQNGWGTVMATDTAFVIGCLALFGKLIPQSLRIFMLSLAIIDDIGAILVVAIGYSDGISWTALVISAIGFILVFLMRKLGIRSITVFFFIGSIIWVSVDASGIHPTITGVILGLMTPTGSWVNDKRLNEILNHMVSFNPGEHWSVDTDDRKALRIAEMAVRETLSPVERLEFLLHPWIGYLIMPLFALANAGVLINFSDFTNEVTIAVFLGFILGKPIGVFSFSFIADFLGLAKRPSDLNWILLACGSILTGIGFTMAIFIANLAFNENLINSARLGIMLASIFCALTGIFMLLIYKFYSENIDSSMSK